MKLKLLILAFIFQSIDAKSGTVAALANFEETMTKNIAEIINHPKKGINK